MEYGILENSFPHTHKTQTCWTMLIGNKVGREGQNTRWHKGRWHYILSAWQVTEVAIACSGSVSINCPVHDMHYVAGNAYARIMWRHYCVWTFKTQVWSNMLANYTQECITERTVVIYHVYTHVWLVIKNTPHITENRKCLHWLTVLHHFQHFDRLYGILCVWKL